jgi:hypothetical protein
MKGYTLIEALLALILAVVLLSLGFLLLGRGNELFGRSSRQLALVTDARTLLDRLVSDCRPALHLETASDPGRASGRLRLTVYRPSSSDPSLRYERNSKDRDAAGFPFDSGQARSCQYFDVVRATYSAEADAADPGAVRVVREERSGFLTRTRNEDGTFAHGFADDRRVPAPARGTMTLAGHVVLFSAATFGLTESRDPVAARTLVALGGGEKSGPVGACVVLIRLESRWPGASDPGSRLQVATKIWIDERVRALAFPGHFSSVDENLGF